MGGGEGSVVAGLDGNERGIEPREDVGDRGPGDTSRVLPPSVAISSSSANSESCVGSRFALNVPSRECAWWSAIDACARSRRRPSMGSTLLARVLSVSATCIKRSYAWSRLFSADRANPMLGHRVGMDPSTTAQEKTCVNRNQFRSVNALCCDQTLFTSATKEDALRCAHRTDWPYLPLSGSSGWSSNAFAKNPLCM